MIGTKYSRKLLKAFAVTLVGLAIFFLPTPAQAQCNPTGAQSALQANTADSRYQAIKYLEGCFQVPARSTTVPVIECDSTGHCGKSPKLFWTTEVRTQGTSARGGSRRNAEGGEYEATVGTIAVNAWDVILSFQRANTNGTWEIDVQTALAAQIGYTPIFKRAIAAPGQSIASASIGPARVVTFSTPELGPVEIHIVRLPVIGVGAFEVPVLPLAIVYGMPQDGKSNNTNSYTLTTARSTSVTSSFSDASTTKGPNDIAYVPPMQNILNTYKSGSDLAKNIPGPLGQVFAVVSQAIPIVQGMLGSMANEQTQGVTNQTGHSLTLTDTQVDKETSGSTLGPGLDDLFVYLRNVKLMWVVMDGKVQLTILSFKPGTSSGQWLLSHKDMPGALDCFPDGACLTAEAYKNLLSLDPFTRPLVNVPYVAGQPIQVSPDMLAPPRFDPASCQDNDFTGSTGISTPSISHTVTQQDQSQTTTFTQTLTDAKAGWLGFAAPSMSPYVVPTTQTTTSTITNTASSSVSATTTITANYSVNGQGNAWGFRSCYDSVYGTFAFVPLQISATLAGYSGQLPPLPGQPPPAGRQVVLQSGGRRYVTFTDRQGRYTFHFPIAPGAAVLTSGTMRTPVQIR